MSPCVSQAKLGSLSLPALSWGVRSSLLGSAKPIRNPGAEENSSGREALGPWGPQTDPRLAGTSHMADNPARSQDQAERSRAWDRVAFLGTSWVTTRLGQG